RYDFNRARTHMLIFHDRGDLRLWNLRTGANTCLLEPDEKRVAGRVFLRQGSRYMMAGDERFVNYLIASEFGCCSFCLLQVIRRFRKVGSKLTCLSRSLGDTSAPCAGQKRNSSLL